MPMRIKKATAILLCVCVISGFAGCSQASPNNSAKEEAPSPSPVITGDLESRSLIKDSAPSQTPEESIPADFGKVSAEPPSVTSAPAEDESTLETTALETGTAPGLSELKDLIDKYISADDDCVWDIWIERLREEDSIRCASLDPGLPMVSASLIKLFIMAAVYEQVELGNINQTDIQSDMRSMITVSDNSAANELTVLLGGGDIDAGIDAVCAYADKIGCKDTSMNRLMLVDNGLQNYTTAADCAVILRMIYNGECVSEEYSEIMLGFLKDQQRTGKIPAGVPDGVVTANKTGELTGLSECDVAIVFTQSGDYVICVLSEPRDNSAAVNKIVEISKLTYSYLAE